MARAEGSRADIQGDLDRRRPVNRLPLGKVQMQELVRDAMLLTEQPAIDDVPFVAAPGLEIQEFRPLVLELEIKFQSVPAGGIMGIDGLRSQPALPLPRDQNFCFLLFHPARPVGEPWRALVVALVLLRRREDEAVSLRSFS